MKKYLIALVALLIVATGCGNGKKLTCTKEDDEANSVVNIQFDKNDVVTTMEIVATTKFEKELNETEKAALEEYAATMCEDYPDDFADCKINVSSKSLELKITYDIANMTEEEKEEFGFSEESGTYDEMKKDAEKDGFTCK